MDEQEKKEREMVIKEAKTWLKTPYVHMGRVKGAGVDCGMLLLEVFERCSLMPHVDIPYYPFDIAAHCSTPMYLNKIKEYGNKTEDEPLPGDVLVYKMEGSLVPHHAAICYSKEFIIHSHVKTGVTLSNRKGFKPFEVGTYRFKKWAGD